MKYVYKNVGISFAKKTTLTEKFKSYKIFDLYTETNEGDVLCHSVIASYPKQAVKRLYNYLKEGGLVGFDIYQIVYNFEGNGYVIREVYKNKYILR